MGEEKKAGSGEGEVVEERNPSAALVKLYRAREWIAVRSGVNAFSSGRNQRFC